MERIKIADEFILHTYDKNNEEQNAFLNCIVEQNKKENYVPNIGPRIKKGANRNFFQTGYFVLHQENLIGYVWLGGIKEDTVYLEYFIEQSHRKQGYGRALLENVSNYVFAHYNIESIYLDIDKSNLASMKTAEASGYQLEEYDSQTGKMLFVKDNLNYIERRVRKR